MQSGVDLAISAIGVLHGFRGGLIRSNARRHTHYSVASFIDGTPGTDSDPGKNCRSVRGAFLSRHNFYFVPVDVGLNLPPQRRSRAPATQSNRGHGNVHLVENRERIFQTVGQTFTVDAT